MKPTLASALALLTCAFTVAAAEPKAPAAAPVPHPVTITFHIAHVQCSSCVDSITESVMKVRSVTKVDELTGDSGHALISFDSHVVSFHQIAQAIAAAAPVHGNAYEATIRIKVPDYAKDDNAAKVDAVFAKSKDTVKVVAKDKAKGEFEVQFLPLAVDKTKAGPQGWNGGKFGHPIHDAAPKGLGLDFQILK